MLKREIGFDKIKNPEHEEKKEAIILYR